MSLHRVLIAAGLAGALMLPLTAVHAQQTTQTTPPNIYGNKSVPGVCMLSRDVVLGASKVGQATSARLKQLAQQARTQLDAERKPLQASIQAFKQKAQSMPASKRASEQKALQQRAAAFQQEVNQLKERIGLTRSKAMQRIGKVVNPLVATIYKKHGCGILIDRDAVLAGNHVNDLTKPVIEALNKKMTTISFNLAPLPKKSSGK